MSTYSGGCPVFVTEDVVGLTDLEVTASSEGGATSNVWVEAGNVVLLILASMTYSLWS